MARAKRLGKAWKSKVAVKAREKLKSKSFGKLRGMVHFKGDLFKTKKKFAGQKKRL